ncbi:hypothetical protein BDZ97DRAFT_1951081 [Flammula alnicola]|nr:hypothetical protein BDZ97DRAFT_1951081 [Flammula alnicola]
MYGELASAETDDQFEPVFRRLQQEWMFIVDCLSLYSLVTFPNLSQIFRVDTAIFSISPGSIFNVDSYARGAITTSSIASGLGIACHVWFLLRYNWADLRTFISCSRDLFKSYFFFSLSARVPALCMFISAVSMMGFLGMVAFDAWPQGIIVMCFLVGLIMTLQFLVFSAHWCVKRVAQGGRAGGMQVVRAVQVVRSMTG